MKNNVNSDCNSTIWSGNYNYRLINQAVSQSCHGQSPVSCSLLVLSLAKAYQLLSVLFIFFSLVCLANPTKAYVPAVKTSVTVNYIDVGPYEVTFNGSSFANNKTTFTYTVERTGVPQGNGLSHLIFGLGTCLNFDDVISATIDGESYNNITGSEGNGTGCDAEKPITTGKIIKFDGLPSNISDGDPHIFTFTVAGNIEVSQSSTTWVKAGNACYAETIAGPGCPKKECELKLELEYDPIACYGGKTTISAKASGSNATLEYSINGKDYVASNKFEVEAGEYEICVREKDNTGCLACKKVKIEQPDKIDFKISSDPITCYGEKTKLTVQASGGAGSYEYSIDGKDYQTSNEFWVEAGKYTICVKDKNDCKNCQELEIKQPNKIKFTLAYDPINCYGGTTTLKVEIDDPEKYEYALNNGEWQASNEFKNLKAGGYEVCVRSKENKECKVCDKVTITEPNPIKFEVKYDYIKCYGDKTTIIVNIDDSYKYEFSLDGGSYQTSNKFEKVGAGKHEVCVRPKVVSSVVASSVITTTYTYNGCEVCKDITIHQPDLLKFKLYYKPITCYGDRTTLYVKEVYGGKGPYKYSLNGGTYQTSNEFKNLKAGWYEVCIKDSKGCIRCEKICIVEPKPITFKLHYKPISCYGDRTTLYVKDVYGGKAPYKYSLNGGTYQTSNEFKKLKAGWYEVRVKDSKGCVRSDKICITQPAPIVIKPRYDPIKYYGGKTTLKVRASGGTGPYLYSINGGKSYQSSNEFKNLKAGTYNICVIDKKGCCMCLKVTIKQPRSCNCHSSEAETSPLARVSVKEENAATPDLIDKLTVSPNPFNDKASIEFTLANSSTYNLVVYDTKGREVKRISAGTAEAGKLHRFELDDSLPTGIYIVSLITNDVQKTFKVSRE